jgi:ribonucleoside-diphosphate reductase subunit M1
MEVTKRNGNKEPVYFDKISIRLCKLIKEGNLKKIDPIKIAQQVIQNLYDGISTLELDNLSARVCASLSSDEPNYGMLGGRIYISNLQKSTPDTFYECVKLLMLNNDSNNEPAPLLSKHIFKIIEDNHELINSKIDHERDYLVDFFGFKTLEKSYLMKSDGNIVERPQYMWMRVSIGIHENNLESAFETYDLMSQKYFTHASPTLFNSGTIRPQLSSCFLTGTSDNIEGIFKTISNCAFISKNAGGIGIHVSNVRAGGSLIRKTNGVSNGIVPMLQVYNYTARYIDQGGRRPGSFAIYLEPWHADVFEFLELRKNTGSETDRARDLFLALWIPDLFMKKVIADDSWYLMCPDECKGLSDVWGDSFEKLYNEYVEEGKYRKKISARTLWNKILESQVETGNPYMLYKDHVNRKSNQRNIGTIKSSNLCAEIVEYSDDKETAVCNLASIAINKYVVKAKLDGTIKIYSKENCQYCKLAKMLLKNHNMEYEEIILEEKDKISNIITDGVVNTVPQIYIDDKRIGGFIELGAYLQPTYDFDKLKEVTKIVCKNLNKVIDVNYYPIPEAKFSNLKHRPIGIGVQGLADIYFMMRFPFESEEAHNLNKEIFETIYFGALEASMELSKERGENIEKALENNEDMNSSKFAYKADDTYYHFQKDISREYAKGAYHTFIGSPLSEGKFQFDLWDVKPSDRWDWNELKENIIKYGVTNSLVTALMPTASTSQILGNNECFEAITSNIYKRRTQAGEFKLINKFLINDMKNFGLWDSDVKDNIIFHNGSVQYLEIPKELKELYKTVWEIKQKHVVIQAAERGPFIDQTQSMNIYMEDADFNKMSSSHIAAWKLGLKTGIYYFRTKPGANAIKFTIDTTKFKSTNNDNNDDNECINCSA